MEFVTVKKEDLFECEEAEDEFIFMNKLLDKNSSNSQKCGEIFISEEEIFNFLCILCEAPFEDVDHFFKHIKSTHKSFYCTEKADPLTSHNNENQNEFVKLEPDIEESNVRSQSSQSNCLEKTSTENNISNQKSVGNAAENKESSNEMWYNKCIKGQSKPICGTCNKSFTTLRSLRRHSKNIHEIIIPLKKKVSQTPHPQANASLIKMKLADLRKSQEEKEADLSETHSEKDSDKCRFCNRKFSEKKKLEEHMTIYCGDKPCKCHTCGKEFRNKAFLWRHEVTHTDSRNYKCNICSSTFKNKSGLSAHMLRHGEKKYACSYCENHFF